MFEKVLDTPEVFRISVELPDNPLRNLNCYVIRDGNASLVIDTGFNRPECRETLWNGLREIGLDFSEMSLFISHLHSDHMGLVWDFVERGIPVYMGRTDYAYYHDLVLEGVQEYTDCQYRHEGCPEELVAWQKVANQGRIFAARPDFPAVLLSDGQKLTVGSLCFTAIWTPGHTPGHMVLYLPEQQLLFSGDHLLFRITPNISIWRGIADPVGDYLNSLRRIAALPLKKAFPAHRQLDGDPYERIAQLKEHYENRLDELYRIVCAHPGCTGYEAASHVHWNARIEHWVDFPPQQQWFASGEAIAHLRTLVVQGRLIRTDAAPYARYFPCG